MRYNLLEIETLRTNEMVEGQTTTHYAMCILHADGGSGVSGHAKFIQVEG